MSNRAYVYAISVDGVVRYIGKGSGKRVTQHLAIARRLLRVREQGQTARASYFHNKLAKALTSGSAITHTIIASGLSEDDAYDREVLEIAGAQDGQLWNRWSGGSGGYFASDALRSLMSTIAKRRADAGGLKYWHDAAHTPEVYKRRGETLKQTYRDRPDIIAKTAEKSSQWWAANKDSQRAKLTAAWARPETRSRHRAYLDSPEGRAKLKAASDARWAKVRASKSSVGAS